MPARRRCQPPSCGLLEPQIRELQRLLGKKTLETEILREAMEQVAARKKLPLRVTSWPGEACTRR